MKKSYIMTVAAALFFCGTMAAQIDIPADIDPGILAQLGFGAKADRTFNPETESWNAKWISVPGASANDYGVYYFRKELTLDSVPAKYPVYVTGDNRYKLYLNGELVSLGPARGDAVHWNYETVDLAGKLRSGKNVITAVVYHEGEEKPEANVSVSTGFLLQGMDEAKTLFTDNSWLCIQDKSYSPVKVQISGYYVSGPGEKVDMSRHISDWKESDCDTTGWVKAKAGTAGHPKNFSGNSLSNAHSLQPSILPQMELKYERLCAVRGDGGLKLAAAFPAQKASFTIPANQNVEILLDQSYLTNAFFSMAFSGGKGSEIHVGYTEALYEPSDKPWALGNKGNRNEVEGKTFIGREDIILPDGKSGREFTTLSWRTYRYVKLSVTTAEEPLSIDDLYGTFIGYPFQLNASLDTDDKELQDMLSIGWRTARLCAIETYMDCPYYEQLQYLGDTRIQALISLYNSGDDRLVKNFFRLSDISRSPEGVTMGRYPSSSSQYITPYALSYVYSLHDYLRYGKDSQFVMDLLPGAEQILHYFSRFQQEDGRLKDLPGWNFSDWVYTPSWSFGAAKKGADGCSILMDLQLLYGYQLMSEMEAFNGNASNAKIYSDRAEKLAASIKASYWSPEKGLFADRSEKDNFSQHANSLAIICGLVEGEQAKAIGQKLLDDQSLSPCSVYYKFYLHEALVKAGLGDHYMEWLDIWRENISLGLTTWAETSDVQGTRSDCHAWGASPNIEFFRTILGIDSDAVGFSKVRIEPHLGDIKKIGGTMPHPDGQISVSYKSDGKKIAAEIILPKGVSGTFIWKGQTRQLKEGANSVKL